MEKPQIIIFPSDIYLIVCSHAPVFSQSHYIVVLYLSLLLLLFFAHGVWVFLLGVPLTLGKIAEEWRLDFSLVPSNLSSILTWCAPARLDLVVMAAAYHDSHGLQSSFLISSGSFIRLPCDAYVCSLRHSYFVLLSRIESISSSLGPLVHLSPLWKYLHFCRPSKVAFTCVNVTRFSVYALNECFTWWYKQKYGVCDGGLGGPWLVSAMQWVRFPFNNFDTMINECFIALFSWWKEKYINMYVKNTPNSNISNVKASAEFVWNFTFFGWCCCMRIRTGIQLKKKKFNDSHQMYTSRKKNWNSERTKAANVFFHCFWSNWWQL